tara:strand:+ start:577 stop:735 length:159 start_codon:yes stop_codon:yes gene_type:complete
MDRLHKPKIHRDKTKYTRKNYTLREFNHTLNNSENTPVPKSFPGMKKSDYYS